MNIIPFKKADRPANPFDQTRAAIAGSENGLFDIDVSQITRYRSGVANGDNSDPIVYEPAAERAMRRLLAHFGFDRLPLTWGEFHGLLDYCENLWMASGAGMPQAALEDWRKSARAVELRTHPWRVPALDAYFAEDFALLAHIHKKERTLERLGSEWREFPYEPGHPLFDL